MGQFVFGVTGPYNLGLNDGLGLFSNLRGGNTSNPKRKQTNRGSGFSLSQSSSCSSRRSSGDGFSLHRRPLLMKFRFITHLSLFSQQNPLPSRSPLHHFISNMATSISTETPTTLPTTSSQEVELDDDLCSAITNCTLMEQKTQSFDDHHQSDSLPLLGSPPICSLNSEMRIERAWAHWKKIGAPKLIVAPMVDNSELPFRMLCRKYGATGAYTPMLHSRIFTETEKYRTSEFTTCKEDRPLFVQFCANNPDILLEAAQVVGPHCDYVDINLGCPQRIARRGNYGAFLMDNLPVIKSLVEKLALNLSVPVSCKVRIFPNLEDTIAYARMLEDAGCALLAVHGRTRDEKDGKKIRADWSAIKAVKNAVRIPVLANGNIRHMDDVRSCLEETGVEGVLSAESLLENPALFAGFRTPEWAEGDESIIDSGVDQADLLVEYLQLCEKYPVPWRMIRAHVHRMLGDWFKIHPHVREDFNKQTKLTFEFLYDMVNRLRELGTRIPLYVKSTDAELSENKVPQHAVNDS